MSRNDDDDDDDDNDNNDDDNNNNNTNNNNSNLFTVQNIPLPQILLLSECVLLNLRKTK